MAIAAVDVESVKNYDHIQSTFAELLSNRLEALNMDSDLPWFEEEFDDKNLSFQSSDIVCLPTINVTERLTHIERHIQQLDVKMELILSKLSAVPCNSVAASAPMAPVYTVPAEHPSSLSPDTPSPASSPSRFQFVCPLCCKAQFTPKSHCEHLRNVIGNGVHNCRFISDHTRHQHILRLFGSAEQFVKWYYIGLPLILSNALCQVLFIHAIKCRQ
jgi:hypothetical protein